MVLPGHLAGGYLATHALLTLGGFDFSAAQTTALYVVGTLAGDFPDIDLAWFYYKFQIRKERSITNHREFITHAPLFWLVLCAAAALIGILFGSMFTVALALVIFVGAWSHLILDTIEGGVRWLWPVSNKRFFALKASEPELSDDKGKFSFYWRYVKNTYVKRVSFYVEIAITLIAVVMAYKQIFG